MKVTVAELEQQFSNLKGFVHGKVVIHTLPDYMSEELTDIVNILADKIKDKQ